MSQSAVHLPFLLEIGTEELPHGVIDPALDALEDTFRAKCAELKLDHGAITTHGTPRRLALLVSELLCGQPDREETVLGPPLSVAHDADGKPTRAAEGFAKKVGAAVEDLIVRPGKRGDVLAAVVQHPGRPAAELLGEALPKLITGLPFPKRMRWESSRFTFSRPIRWLVALLGDEIVPFELADLRSGATSRGHRILAPEPFELAGAPVYVDALRQRHVMVDRAERRERIVFGLATLCDEGARVVDDDELVETVTHLVEWPHPALGSFDERYIELPREVLTTVLRHHQKIFAVEDTETGDLRPSFAVVLGTEPADESRTLVGNARVIRARLDDARFFYEDDRKKPLADRAEALSGIVYLKGMGTMLDRADRLEKLAARVCEETAPEAKANARRAALLCKADLTTAMVYEFPELQGIMGRIYAGHDEEPDEVCQAVFEHYQPRFAGDDLPATAAGAVLALAERADAIVSCFAVGLAPKGSQDPYALRRAAIGSLRILEERGWSFGWTRLLELAAEGVAAQGHSTEGVVEQATGFVRARARVHFTSSLPVDLVDAVLAIDCDVPADLRSRAEALHAARSEGWFDGAAVAFKRIQNISRDHLDASFDEALFEGPAESSLVDAFRGASGGLRAALEAGEHRKALTFLSELRPHVDRFFDDVLVMTDNEAVRKNRLGLLRTLADDFGKVADFTRIQADATP
jgi:glycyl-tRNA synthetase beta chain